MNREIKFRAWEVNWSTSQDVQGRMIQWEDIRDDFALILRKNTTFIVMQYTGLKDKNGKEIYEGDIVKNFIKDYSGHVIFEDGAFCVKDSIGSRYLGKDLNMDDEIIGNFYENPELLT